MNIIVCDDNTLVCESLVCDIKNIDATINIITFKSCFAVYEYLNDNGNDIQIDAILMDIEFPHDLNGIDYSHEIFKKFPNIKILFISGFTEKYVEDMFLGMPNFKPYAILKKPIDLNKLKTHIDNLKTDHSIKSKENILTFNAKNGTIFVEFERIQDIYSFQRKVTIVTYDGEYTGYNKISNLMKELKSLSNRFYNCHKSYIVNVDAITKIPSNENFVYIGTTGIPLSIINGTSVSHKRKDIIKLRSLNHSEGGASSEY